MSLGRFNRVTREILAVSLGKFSFAPTSKSKFFRLFSVATSVCQCYMNMRNILQSNLTNKTKAMIRQIKQEQWLRNKNKMLYFWNKNTFPPLNHMIERNYIEQHKEKTGGNKAIKIVQFRSGNNLYYIDYKCKALISAFCIIVRHHLQ